MDSGQIRPTLRPAGHTVDADGIRAQMSKNLLVFGASETALAVVRQAHRDGWTSSVIDEIPDIAFQSRHPREKILVADLSSLDPAGVRELIRRDDTAVVCTSDRWLRFFTEHWDRLGVADWLHPVPAVVDCLLDKMRFSQWCTSKGITTPQIYTPERVAQGRLAYPVLVRPNKRRLLELRTEIPKTKHVLSPEELSPALESFRRLEVDVVVTESLLTRELLQYSVPFVRKNGKTLLYVAEKVRPRAGRCEIGTYVRTVRNEAAANLVQSMLEALGYEGIGEAELLYDVELGSHYVIEINARPWTQFQLSIDTGYDFLRYYFDQAPPLPAQEGAWLDLAGDLRVVFAPKDGMYFRDELSLAHYFDCLRKATSYSVWNIHDPLPVVRDTLKNIRKLFSA